MTLRHNTLIGNVRALRQQRGWSHLTLANEMTAAGCHTSEQRILKLEVGYRSSWAVDELLALADVFGTTVEELAGERLAS